MIVLIGCSDAPGIQNITENGNKSEYTQNTVNYIKINTPSKLQSIRLSVPAESNLRDNTIADMEAGIKGMAGLSEDISEEFHYLRFSPKNMEESAALLDYDVFPIPFDAEVVSQGYLNRETDGGISSYYCLVRTDRELPDVEYEIINTLKLVCQSDGAATNYFTPEQWQKKCEYERQNKDDDGRYSGLRGVPQKYGFRFTVQDNFISKKIGIQGIEVMV